MIYLHSGDECLRSINDISGVPINRPDRAGSRWKPVPHDELVTAIYTHAVDRGWELSDLQMCLTADASGVAGSCKVAIPNLEAVPGIDFELGFRSCNDLTSKVVITAGGRVIACTNGLLTGVAIMAKKHTTRLDLMKEIGVALDLYADQMRQAGETIERWKATPMSPAASDMLLVEAGRLGILPWSRIGMVEAEYRKPSFDEPSFHERTAWALMNAFTHIVKKQPVMRQMPAMNEFRELLEADITEATELVA